MEMWTLRPFAWIVLLLSIREIFCVSSHYIVHDDEASTLIPMFIIDVRSKIECATQCDVTESCVSATVSGTETIVCKLYSLANFGTTYSVTGTSLLRIKDLVPDTTTGRYILNMLWVDLKS